MIINVKKIQKYDLLFSILIQNNVKNEYTTAMVNASKSFGLVELIIVKDINEQDNNAETDKDMIPVFIFFNIVSIPSSGLNNES